MTRLRSALTAAGIVVASLVPFAPSASAATGDLAKEVTFTCLVPVTENTPSYTWNPTVTLSAVRPAGTNLVTVTAHTTEMEPVSPVALNYNVTNQLKLTADGGAVTLAGSGRAVAPPNSEFMLPDTTGTFTSTAPEVAVAITGYTFKLSGLTGTCTPTAGAAMGNLTIVTGTPPPPPVTPTTITSATAKPGSGTSASATPTADATGEPAQGKAAYACVLHPLGSAFTYNPTITVAGYRSSPSADVSLSATMTNLPGIAPVVIDGTMNVTLGLTVGGKKTTLAGTTQAKADPKQAVPVPTLTGTVAAAGDELAVLVRTFTFNFPDMSIDASCTAKSVSIGTLTVGTEAASGSGSGSGTGSGTLPATGATNVGVVLVWGFGLIAMGGAGIVLLRRRATV